MNTQNATAAEAIDAALSRLKQSNVAAELNWPESKVSELKKQLQKDGSVFLKHLNLMVVPDHLVCVDPKKLETMIAILQIAMPGLTINQLKVD